MKQIFDKENKYGHKVYQLTDIKEAPRHFVLKVETKDLTFILYHSYMRSYDLRYWDSDEKTSVILKQRSNNTKNEQEEFNTLYGDSYELIDSSAAQAREFPNYEVIPELLFAFQYYLSNKEQLLTKTKFNDEYINDKYIKDVFIENIAKACKSEKSNNKINAKGICDELFGEGTIDIDKAIESQVDEQLKIMESKETQRLEEDAEATKKPGIKETLKNHWSAFKLAVLKKRKANNNNNNNNNNPSKNNPEGPSI